MLRLQLRLRRAAFHVVFVEHAFGDGVRRPLEPSLGLYFGAAQYAVPFGHLASDLDVVEAHRDDRARADIGAAPLPAGAPKFLTDFEFGMLHGHAAATSSRPATGFPAATGRAQRRRRPPPG
jgi:hypothetical protein